MPLFPRSWYKSSHQRRVEAFMRGSGQAVPSFPQMPTEGTRKLRAALILEECLETIEALGYRIVLKDGSPALTPVPYNSSFSLEKIIDGCCDVQVVTTGTLSACGVPDMPFLIEVDRNNMDKVEHPCRNYDTNGKLLKPKGHSPPRITEILSRFR